MPRPTPGGPQAGEPARTHALAALRQAILSGDVAPGQRLVEEELAGLLKVTRASLRAALIDLAAEGLVERVPNRGARVRVVSPDEAIAITECRMALEELCAVKAAQNVTDDEAARLRELGCARAAPSGRWASTWPSSTRSPTDSPIRPTSPSGGISAASSRRCGRRRLRDNSKTSG